MSVPLSVRMVAGCGAGRGHPAVAIAHRRRRLASAGRSTEGGAPPRRQLPAHPSVSSLGLSLACSWRARALAPRHDALLRRGLLEAESLAQRCGALADEALFAEPSPRSGPVAGASGADGCAQVRELRTSGRPRWGVCVAGVVRCGGRTLAAESGTRPRAGPLTALRRDSRSPPSSSAARPALAWMLRMTGAARPARRPKRLAGSAESGRFAQARPPRRAARRRRGTKKKRRRAPAHLPVWSYDAGMRAPSPSGTAARRRPSHVPPPRRAPRPPAVRATRSTCGRGTTHPLSRRLERLSPKSWRQGTARWAGLAARQSSPTLDGKTRRPALRHGHEVFGIRVTRCVDNTETAVGFSRSGPPPAAGTSATGERAHASDWAAAGSASYRALSAMASIVWPTPRPPPSPPRQAARAPISATPRAPRQLFEMPPPRWASAKWADVDQKLAVHALTRGLPEKPS